MRETERAQSNRRNQMEVWRPVRQQEGSFIVAPVNVYAGDWVGGSATRDKD